MLPSKLKNIWLIVLILFVATSVSAQSIVALQQGRRTSIRGLSVLNDKVAWVSGSGGHIGITTDGGNNWTWQQVKGFEKADFRDIEAFSDKEAVIISSGSPAYILKTTDGGINWSVKYEKADTVYFLDAMDFENPRHGFVLGDPINGKFLLLETQDGGNSWAQVNDAPAAQKNEAAFAASGTCLRVADKRITIVTGGGDSHVITSPINKLNWSYNKLPLTNGAASKGAFSIAYGKKQAIVVGGDYVRNKATDSVAYIFASKHDFKKGAFPSSGPAGYQSGVEFIKDGIFVSTGTSGTNITLDGGKTWRKIGDDSYNVCRIAKNGSLILLAGDGGKVSLITLDKI
ncbi:WD40/YVTN/BNR-like repeat-containing protein [Mucilaginibacter litoreus]|uniref:WD40/YVTN/BNR-like repeat-containing protein n=1 Tax=Mucilaginibacter litoreus TaxID=1048221 RepID=A0ABW3APH7_9SPHI